MGHKAKAITGVVMSVCGAPGGNHPLCLCKDLSCECPDIPVLVSTGDTTITPPLLNHSYYLKGHMPDMLQQLFCRARWARVNLIQCSVFPVALQVLCPGTGASTDKEVACNEDHRVWLSREPYGRPCLVLQQTHSEPNQW